MVLARGGVFHGMSEYMDARYNINDNSISIVDTNEIDMMLYNMINNSYNNIMYNKIDSKIYEKVKVKYETMINHCNFEKIYRMWDYNKRAV